MFRLLKLTAKEFSKDKCTRMAAALAYYTAFSLAPLLILVIALCGLIWQSSEVQGTIESGLRDILGSDGAQQVRTMLVNASSSEKGFWPQIMSMGLLFVGATGLVGQLQSALNDAWAVKPDPSRSGWINFLVKRLLSFAMICTAAFLLLVSMVVSSVLTALGDRLPDILPGVSEIILKAANSGISFLVIALLFAAMFKFLPDADVKWSDVGVGAVLTAALFVLGKFAIGAYLGSKNMESAYGAAGSLAIVMLWIYFSSIIFLFGAEFTQVWARTKGGGVEPAERAVEAEDSAPVKDDADQGLRQSNG